MTDAQQAPIEVYQLRVYLREISPLIWHRLLVRSDSTIADLHYTLQIALGWTDFHLHLLLQVRLQTLNKDLKATFGRWYPAMPHMETPLRLAA